MIPGPAVAVFWIVIGCALYLTWPWWILVGALYVLSRLALPWRDRYRAAKAVHLAAVRAQAREAALHRERLRRVAVAESTALLAMRREVAQQAASGASTELSWRP